jgi:hypothetical protein
MWYIIEKESYLPIKKFKSGLYSVSLWLGKLVSSWTPKHALDLLELLLTFLSEDGNLWMWLVWCRKFCVVWNLFKNIKKKNCMENFIQFTFKMVMSYEELICSLMFKSFLLFPLVQIPNFFIISFLFTGMRRDVNVLIFLDVRKALEGMIIF